MKRRNPRFIGFWWFQMCRFWYQLSPWCWLILVTEQVVVVGVNVTEVGSQKWTFPLEPLLGFNSGNVFVLQTFWDKNDVSSPAVTL